MEHRPHTLDPPNTYTVPLLLPLIPPGLQRSFAITLFTNASNAHQPFEVCFAVSPLPWIADLSASAVVGDPDAKECVGDILYEGAFLTVGELWPVSQAGLAALQFLSTAVKNTTNASKAVISAVQFNASLYTAPPISQALPQAVVSSLDGLNWLATAGSLVAACRKFISDQPSCISGQVITSGDPNDLVGNPGIGDGRWVAGKDILHYSILFENEPSESASAQYVQILDNLDLVSFDLDTLQLGPINIAGLVITPPAVPISILGAYITDVDLRPSQSVIVHLKSTFDASRNALKWVFTTIDPETGLPTSNPLNGFLPPGQEGSVSLSVVPKVMATGNQVSNKATVAFDTNAPISTPTWSNTIDNTAPTSSVAALPSTEGSYGLPVQWSGADVGAGIQDFTIYVSDNGGPFTAWLTNTTATQGTYTGVGGHTYAFYSIARDLVGNVEAAKTVAEATTQIVIDTTPPVIVPQITGTLGNNGWYTSNVTVTWSVSDPESGIASTTGCANTTLTADTAGVSLGCTATNGAGLSSSAGVTIQIDKTPPTVSDFRVLFGSQSYSLIGSVRNRLPWQITGIQAVFSEPIAGGNVASLTGVPGTALTGLGTNTLTWTLSPISIGNFTAGLAGSGVNALTDIAGNPLTGGIASVRISVCSPVISMTTEP